MAVVPVFVLAIGLGWVPVSSDDHASALAPEFGPSAGIWIDRATLLALPTSGDAWADVAADATGDWGAPNIADQDSNHDVMTLAGALYAVRTNDVAVRAKTVAAIEGAIGTEAGGRTLALARNLTGYVLAADLIGYRSDRFVTWLTAVRFADLDGRTLVSTHEDRPNNWGTHAGAARIAADRFIGDRADLDRAISVFRGYLGDRAAYADFKFGDATWQADGVLPVPINPAGSTKNGIDVDGAIVDDIRRCECPVSSPAPRESYQWEAMQGIVAQAALIDRAGQPDVWQWSDAAIRRAVDFLYVQADYPAEGDDRFLTYLVDAHLGTDYSDGQDDRSGKSLGYTGWTHVTSGVVTTSTAAPSTTVPTTPVATTTATTIPTVTTAAPSSTTTVTTSPSTTSTTTTSTTSTTTPPPSTTALPTSTTSTTAPSTTPTLPGADGNAAALRISTAPTAGSSRASDSTAVHGTETGTFEDTWSRGDGAHTLTEAVQPGKSSRRHDRGELRWTIGSVAGDQVLDVVMTVGPDSGDADEGFALEWSSNGTDWTPIALVASDTTLDLVVDLGVVSSPSIEVRVVDSDRSRGERLPDWVSVDFLRVRQR